MQVAKLLKYQLRDLIRNKWLLFYTLFFLLVTEGLFRFSGAQAETLLSLMNLTLLFIPLVSVLFGTLYLYNSREFVTLMLSQPIARKNLFWGIYLGLTLPLVLAYFIGIGMPFLWYGISGFEQVQALLMLGGTGALLTFIFVAIAFWLGTHFLEERIKGMGFALGVWLLLAIVYDGIILMLVFIFGDYPLESPVIAVSLFNPIDLARILILMKFNISALMGYTGALFRDFFGNNIGMVVSTASLLIWLMVPLGGGLRRFMKKDF